MEANPAAIRALRSRLNVIADRWCQSIMLGKPEGDDDEGMRRRVMALTDQLLTQLTSDEAEPDTLRAIGRGVADICHSDPAALGRSLSVLTQQVASALPASLQVYVLPRLAAVIGEVTTGYLDQANKAVLRERDEIRSAHDLTHRQLQKAVRRSEEKYRALVESANQAIFIVDRSGVFRFMNGSSARQLGGKASDFIGRNMRDLFPADVARRHMANVLKALNSGDPLLSESETVLQGKRHWRETSLQPLRDEEGEYATVLGISTDITERKRAESSLKEYSERLRTLREIDRAILAAQSPQEIAQTTLDNVRRLLPVPGGAVVLFEANGAAFRVLSGAIGHFVSGSSYENSDSGSVAKSRKAEGTLLDGDRVSPHQLGMLTALGRAAGQHLLLIPLIVQTELIGALALDIERPTDCSEQQLEVAREVAAPLAIAIQNARLLEAERKARDENARLLNQVQQHAGTLEQLVAERTRDLSALYAVTAVANEHLEIKSLLEVSLERVAEALGCQAASAHLANLEEDRLELVALAGSWPHGENARFVEEASAGLADQVYEDKAPVIRTAFANEVDNPAIDHWRPPNVSAGVPMRARGEILGVLCVFCSKRDEFAESDIALLGSIADQVGGAVENARLRLRAEQGAVMLERDRLARELHDSVTQALYSLTLFAEAALDRTRDQQMNVVQQHLEDIELTAHQALKEMRLLLYELRSTPLVPEGLMEALRHRLDAVETRAGVQARLIAGSLENLPSEAEDGLYRIAQEALNNVLKHSEASTVSVEFWNDPDFIFMEISDDGCGFDRDAVLQRGGMGLSTMRERAEFLDGVLTIASEPGQGTRVLVKIEKAGLGILED